MSNPSLIVHRIPAFNDNYFWLLQASGSPEVLAVDPGDAAPVNDYLRANRLKLSGVLLTHHHPDHIGGVAELRAERNLPVYGPATARFQSLVTKPLQGGDLFQLFDQFDVRVIDLPGHTLDHIGYYLAPQGQPPLLFPGDTLFAGGCGRLFEGSPAQMHQSLTTLAQLPDTTEVYCAHEYTLANLRFALAAEPGNTALQQRFDEVTRLRQQQQPTIPTTIALEKATNPFLRVEEIDLIQQVSDHAGENLADPVAVFAATRRWKDNF